MKKIIFGISALVLLVLTSCEQNTTNARYVPVNRQKAIFLVDQETGEVFMMSLIAEKGVGVTGAKWKAMGSPSDAR